MFVEGVTVAAVKSKKRGVLELWGYHADQDAWKPLFLHGNPLPGTPAWNQLVYDPTHQCFFFLNVLMTADGRTGKTDGFFAFRLHPEGKKAQ